MSNTSTSKIHRKPYGKGFTYRFETGQTVKNKALKRWIVSLVIPPAWQEVVIDPNRDAKIHVHGRDSKGRKQYIYNPDWVAKASEAKFNRIVRFGKQLETMRRVTSQHIKQRPLDEQAILACMTRMIDEAFFRPGHSGYTRENNTYGLTTLRCKHMDVGRKAITFDYDGKSHKRQHREVKDDLAREVLIDLEKMPGYELFDVTLPDKTRKKLNSAQLNEYITQVMGEDFSAKDFRTWAGTVLMAVALDLDQAARQAKEDASKPPKKTSKAKNTKNNSVVQCVKSVAQRLGNTPAVCKSNYIHPKVILNYENGRTLSFFKKQLRSKRYKYLDLDEKATLRLLNSK